MCNKIHEIFCRIHNKLSRISLRSALVMYVIIPMTLALGITGHLALSALEKSIEKNMQRDLELIAKAIQLPLSSALESEETTAIYSALDSAFSIGEIYSAYLYDQKGNEIALAGPLESEPQSEKLTELIDEGEEHGGYGDVAGSDVYSYFIPLSDSGGKVSGMLQLTRKESDFVEYIRNIRIQGQIVLALGLLVMTGLVLYGQHRAMGRHFSSLISSMSRVARGDRQHRFQSGGPKEIAAIGQLSAGIAHELGTPLSIVTARAQRALRKKDISEDTASALKSIRAEVSRMEYIIRQLLDFSRSSRLQKRSVPLSMPAQSSLSAVSDLTEKHNVQLKPETDTQAIEISLDPVRIEQALVNLLRNAIQSAHGGQVVLSWGYDENNAWYQVDDSGPGIPEDVQPKIFEPFFTTKNVGTGTGLGLSVAHGIVEEHKGRIKIENSHLGGARFRIVLPKTSSE
ncbi:MAG: two-component sensor histidine kinase [Desulfovibrionales bacterium]|nr:two-component sensor histidine kinase [Desulfovibrionales bacterium]